MELQLSFTCQMKAYDEYINKSKWNYWKFLTDFKIFNVFCWKFWDLAWKSTFKFFLLRFYFLWTYNYHSHIKWELITSILNNLNNFCRACEAHAWLRCSVSVVRVVQPSFQLWLRCLWTYSYQSYTKWKLMKRILNNPNEIFEKI